MPEKTEERTREDASLSVNEWMRDVINACTPPGDFRVHDVAGDVWERALTENPDMFWGWLQVNGAAVIRNAIRNELRQRRSGYYRQERGSAWLAAADQFNKTGDETVFSPFEMHYSVDEQHTQRRVGDMRGTDHLFVASREQGRADFAGLRASFHRRVAEVIGERTTEEVMTEEQYNKLFDTIVGRQEPDATPDS